MKIVLTTKLPQEGFELLKDHQLIVPSESQFTHEELIAHLIDCDILIPTYDYKIDAVTISKATQLKLIANFGVGFNNIDIDYATRHHITVTNTPDPVIEPTAEQAFTLMLSVAHRTAELDRKMRMPNSPITIGVMNNLGIALHGKRLGIIGMGRIGQSFAKRAKACGMEICYHNRHHLPEATEKELSATYLSLDELLATSDFISLHMPYTSESHHLIDKKAFAQMKQGAVLINTARGAVVDEEQLIANLQSKKLYGAGLDVFEFEPKISEALLSLDNVVMSPHIGTGTIDGRLAMCRCVSQNILAFLNGKGHLDRVN